MYSNRDFVPRLECFLGIAFLNKKAGAGHLDRVGRDFPVLSSVQVKGTVRIPPDKLRYDSGNIDPLDLIVRRRRTVMGKYRDSHHSESYTASRHQHYRDCPSFHAVRTS